MVYIIRVNASRALEREESMNIISKEEAKERVALRVFV
jgi:hypothetical protein